jgi:hypothetical protein
LHFYGGRFWEKLVLQLWGIPESKIVTAFKSAQIVSNAYPGNLIRHV